MAEPIVLGIVGIKNMGEYNSQTNYEKLNVVTYQGSSYCAKKNCRGETPTNSDYWQLYAEKGERGNTGPSPIKGVDYYTSTDKAEIENDLAGSITSEVSAQLNDLTSATPLAASSISEMTDTTRIYVNTSDGHWYWYNGTTWVDGGVYQSTINPEVEDIRISEDGNVYVSAGNSVRNQIKDNKLLIDINEQTIKSSNWNKNTINLPADLFEIGGINSSNGTNSDSTLIIRTKSYLNFADIFKYLYVTGHTDPEKNKNIYIYELDGTYVGYQSLNTGIPFQNLTPNKKYRLALVDNTTVSSVATTLAKFDFEIVSYIKLRDDIFDIEELNLINPAYTVENCILDYDTGFLKYSSGLNSSICVPIEAETQYYDDNANFYTAFFDENMDLIGSVHYTGHNPLTSPFTTPEGACYMAKSFRTADIESSAFISKASQFYSNSAISIKVKDTIYNKPILENDLHTSVLNNKTINVYGDSISSTDYTLPYWGSIIAESTGCTINNYGISGTTLAHTNDRHLWDYHFTRLDAEEIGYVANDPSTWWSGNCFCERFIKVDDSADGIVIMGGTNDNTVQLGTWNSTDISTFYGALNILLQGISERMAGKKILVCTPIQTANSYSSNVNNASDVLANTSSTSTLSLQLRAEAIKEKCKQYGINCLDLYNCSGINGIDNSHIYYRSNDNLHPSSYGQVRIATLIQSKLEELFK